jgi:hypothetical protein
MSLPNGCSTNSNDGLAEDEGLDEEGKSCASLIGSKGRLDGLERWILIVEAGLEVIPCLVLEKNISQEQLKY